MTYGCHNRAPYVEHFPARNGEHRDGTPRSVLIPFRMERDCQFTKTDIGQADPGCAGCEHKEAK